MSQQNHPHGCHNLIRVVLMVHVCGGSLEVLGRHARHQLVGTGTGVHAGVPLKQIKQTKERCACPPQWTTCAVLDAAALLHSCCYATSVVPAALITIVCVLAALELLAFVTLGAHGH